MVGGGEISKKNLIFNSRGKQIAPKAKIYMQLMNLPFIILNYFCIVSTLISSVINLLTCVKP